MNKPSLISRQYDFPLDFVSVRFESLNVVPYKNHDAIPTARLDCMRHFLILVFNFVRNCWDIL